MNVAGSVAPAAQTFKVNEPGGIVVTAIGLWFYSKPDTTDIPITLEIRPCGESGFPSSTKVYPNTRVTKTPAQVSTSEFFSAGGNETKFTLTSPLYLPYETEAAIVLHTNAQPGEYRFWVSQQGEFAWINGSQSTAVRCSPDVASGSFYASSNGTSWNAEQTKDFAFKVYKASFTHSGYTAVLNPDVPPIERLSHREEFNDPLIMTEASTTMSVLHHNHGFNIGDFVKLGGLDSNGTTNGVRNTNIIGKRRITAVDPFGYSFTMDSAADSSIRAGGTTMTASQQYNIDAFRLNLASIVPNQYTSIQTGGKFATQKSYANNETAYGETNNVLINPGRATGFKNPHVLASKLVEDSDFSGQPSTEVRVTFNTQDRNSAPYINLAMTSMDLYHHLIDFQDSDNYVGNDRNLLSTINYVSETNAENGTALATHITRPVTLIEPANSLRVIVDVSRPTLTEFDIYYRVTNTNNASTDLITEKAWTAFSKTPTLPDNSNYQDVPQNDDASNYKEYRFNKYDLNDFNQYQIKVVMNSRKSTHIVKMRNLRTIATV